MTIKQFIQDTYLGKVVKFKIKDGFTCAVYSGGMDLKEMTDKVVEARKQRGSWNLYTLNGWHLPLHDDMEYEIDV